MKTFVTFGQNHAHSVDGKTFDKDCVAVVSGKDYAECHANVQELFGLQYCTDYPEEHWKTEWMAYYPDGYVNVN